jgi:hypothetical protein
MVPQTARKWWGWWTPARWALAAVALVEVFLFTGFHWDRWSKSLLPLNRPQALQGEGLVIRCDGHGYYAWLRSLLIDGDWSFDNEFDEHNVVGDFVPPPEARTDLGRRVNQWSVGPACLWAVTIVPGHFGIRALQSWGLPWAADGYSLPYQLLVGVTTLLSSFLSLGFVYSTCRRYAEPVKAALAAAFLILGTTIVFYGSIEVSMAHSVGPAAIAALEWYWLKTYGSARPGRWFLVGVLVGLAALMRWQLVTFAFLPAGECFLAVLKAGRKQPACRWDSVGPGLGLTSAGIGAIVAFLPQLVAWRCVYGHWLVTPIAVNHNWLTPSWGRVLLSEDRGLFSWTPMTLLGCIGFHYCRKGEERLALLFGAFALQVYLLASLWGEMVELGVSYGLRHFTESVVALGPGLALLLERSARRGLQIVGGLGCLLVMWNLVLICQYRYGWIPAATGVDLSTLLANVPRLILRKRLLLVGQVLAGPLVLAWVVSQLSSTRIAAEEGDALSAGGKKSLGHLATY